jgi:hypothetical protein
VYDDGTVDNDLDSQKLINSGQTNFQDWQCNIGLESLFVQYDGNIKLGNCITAPTIGKIQEFDNIEWTNGPITCRQNYCNCSTDIYVSKWQVVDIVTK